MKTKTSRSKAQAIRDYLNKHPGAKASTLVSSFDVSLPYAYTVMNRVKGERLEWDRKFENVPLALPSPDMVPTEVEDEDGNFASDIPAPTSPLQVQISGSHYKDMKIQPVEFINANKLSFLEGCIVKRISRWRSKDGLKDLEKIKHEVDLLIELEGLK